MVMIVMGDGIGRNTNLRLHAWAVFESSGCHGLLRLGDSTRNYMVCNRREEHCSESRS